MLERRFVHSVELRASQGDEGSMIISGYAARFGKLSEPLGAGRGAGFRECLVPGCFQRSLQSDRDVACLLNHDSSLLLGRKKNGTLSVAEDGQGLRFRCNVANTSVGRDTYSLIKRGDIDACSFAFEIDGDGDSWSEIDDPDTGARTALRTINQCKLYDCSVVAQPAYKDTSVSADARSLNPSPLVLWPQGLPESFPREIRSMLLTSGFRKNDARRRVIDFVLSL